jgi:lantibiotic modifying enzyme
LLGRGSLERVLAMPHGSEPLDVIDGLAGAIQALLAVARVAADRELEDGACALARRLAARGRTADGSGAWCWPDPDALDKQALTGMSHGAAGIGLALLEASLASGDGELLEAARGAFRYEDTRYVADQRNWLDLRAGAEDAPGTAASCGLTWCHGAPGIALARLRALEICAGEQAWRDDADAALVTTRAELARRRRQAGLDATLCHGTCGLAEALLVAGEHAERIDARGARADAEAFAAEVAVAWSRGDQVSGVPSGGSNPSLMLGSAGVGWFLLRALDPAGVPAILGAPGRWTA